MFCFLLVANQPPSCLPPHLAPCQWGESSRVPPSAPLMTLWEMINISRLCMKASPAAVLDIHNAWWDVMCRAVCSLTRQLFWEEWETCLESWMAQRQRRRRRRLRSHAFSTDIRWPTWREEQWRRRRGDGRCRGRKGPVVALGSDVIVQWNM